MAFNMLKYPTDVRSPAHTQPIFDPPSFKEVVKRTIQEIRNQSKRGIDIKALAASGNSGIPVAAAVCYELDIHMILVRKQDERCYTDHGGFEVTGYNGSGDYAIIDDLVASGNTVRHIWKKVDEANGGRLNCAGIMLYNSYTDKFEYNVDGYSRYVPIWRLY